MTATDELRGGLRELGVQYQACGDSFTMWKHDGKTATYAEYPEGGKLKAFVTPEQAIAATVGDTDATGWRHVTPRLSVTAWHVAELQVENAKLRELVRDMYKAFQRVFPDGHRLDFEIDMRELGVEVPDGD